MPAKRPSPWVWVMVNQLAFPGLGTILMGRKIGYVQAAIMVAGFILSMGFMLWYIVCVGRFATHQEWTQDQFHALYRPYQWSLFWGLGLCAVAWLWALFSSVSALRKGDVRG